jgi:hypothetical protein
MCRVSTEEYKKRKKSVVIEQDSKGRKPDRFQQNKKKKLPRIHPEMKK